LLGPKSYNIKLLFLRKISRKMLILVETPAGFALFELKDKGVLKEVDTICDKFNEGDNAKNM
jgi:hypothetical protein